MEAVPRLPMINFDLLTTGEKISFGLKLKSYIASFYQEDPESYNTEIHSLEGLRASAVWPAIDITNCNIMKKYYCQLHFLKSRFPMEENQVCSVYFSWKDDFTKMSCSVPDINFELLCMLINIGSIHTKLGAEDSRISPEGMKMSCTHFQCAAWAYQTVREVYGQMIGLIMISSEQIRGMELVCLAQAQECILEKSLLDNRKASIIAKIAVQLSDYYRQAVIAFQCGEEGLVSDHLPNNKFVIQYLHFKVAYHRCIALLYQGQQAEEQQKMGERVAFYAAALEVLQDASRQVSKMSNSNQALFKDTIAFTLDVVEGKRKAAANENEFIYHEDVPQLETLQEIKGASLVKGIAFQVQDLDISGPDIFGRLVPMEAHEASSLYSEQKAHMLRVIGEKVEKRDHELNEFLSSLQLDVLHQMKSAKGLTQDVVDRAAEMVARPTATKDLIEAMGKLSNSYQEVEAMLKDIQEMLKEEEQAEKDYQDIMGKRPPSIIATDLSREAAKYQEAHGKASESNQNLHKAMITHVANLKILAQPISQLKMHIPSLQLPDPNIDEKIMFQMENLANKIDEMKKQRINLWNQLRESVHKDDITGTLVTRPPEQPLDVFFQHELDKHKPTGALIDQNLVAQDNICKAVVEVYAQFTPTRKYLQDFISKRNNTIGALNASYDTYDDLLAKANKGIEFYAKLETNVAKLLQRIKSACKVQQEEREQILIKNGHAMTAPKPEPEISNRPKLKDYLDSVKDKRNEGVIGPTMQYPTSSMYPTQDVPHWPKNEAPVTMNNEVPVPTGYTQNFNASVIVSNYGGYNYPPVGYPEKNLDQITDGMTALKITNQHNQYDYSNTQTYSYPPNYNAPSTSYDLPGTNNTVPPVTNYSNPTSSYQTVSNTPYPFVTTSEQYNSSTMQNGINSNTSGYGSNTTSVPAIQANVENYYEKPTVINPNEYYNYGGNNIDSSQTYPYYNSENYNSTNQYINHAATAIGVQNPPSSITYSNVQYCQSQTTAHFPVATSSSISSYQISNYPENNASGASYSNGVNYSQTSNYQYPVSTYEQGNNVYNPNTLPSYESYNTATTSLANNSYPSSTSININSNYPAGYQTPSTTNLNNSASVNQANTNYANNYPTTNNTSNVPINQQNSSYPITYPITTTPNINISATVGDNSYYNQYTPNDQYTAPTANYPQDYNPYNNYDQYNTPYSQTNYQQAVPTYSQTATIQNYNLTSDSKPQENTPKKETNIDLLAGLDFSISQAPLIPQKEVKADPEIREILPAKKEEKKVEEKKPEPAKPQRKKVKNLIKGDPFKNPDTLKKFLEEVDKFEKYVESLNVKTLSGPSNLELKWKEIQDSQENLEVSKRSISVARCYPLKNRSADILPYDYSRVELTTTKDDYINASHIKDVSPYSMDYIITQNPTHSSFPDFWSMVWEQQVELIVCLLSPVEMKDDIYWPPEVGKQLNFGTKSITLLSTSDNEFWLEHRLNMEIFEQKEIRIITIMQYTMWPGSLFPSEPLAFVKYAKKIITLYEQQKCSGNPVLIHCHVGVGRSGICSVLLTVLMEFAATACPLPDIPSVASKISCARKNILRDREHLKFIFTALLSYTQTIKKEYTKSDKEKADDEVPVEKAPIDPLSTLDPLWATRKS